MKERNTQKELLSNLPKGLSSIPLPEAGTLFEFSNSAYVEPKTAKEIQKDLTTFLNELNKQKLDLIAILQYPVTINAQSGSGYGESHIRNVNLKSTQSFAIVRKS